YRAVTAAPVYSTVVSSVSHDTPRLSATRAVDSRSVTTDFTAHNAAGYDNFHRLPRYWSCPTTKRERNQHTGTGVIPDTVCVGRHPSGTCVISRTRLPRTSA